MADDSGLLELSIYVVPVVIFAVMEYYKKVKKTENTTRYKDMLYSDKNTTAGAVLDPRKADNTVSYHNEFCALSINNETKQVFIAADSNNYGGSLQHVYNFDNIVNVEIQIDGVSVASPSIGGAIVGGVLFGGAGAIVGSSAKTTNQKIKNIALKIYVDDLKSPFLQLYFYKGDTPVITNHPWVVQPQKEVNEWYSRFLNIIEKRKLLAQAGGNNNGSSVADELAKLSNLLKEGVISQEEFDSLKKKTLGL
jgi:hypothetical protein